MSPVLLHGAGVEKRFGRVSALRGIDFEIKAGDSISILGANGAGKSTLLRILAGLSRPSKGRFEARRKGATGSVEILTRAALRGEVGYVGHATLVYGELTARENLVFAARLHGARHERDHVDAVLADVGLQDVADRRAGTFSRGMAQRLAIARAIVHDPQVLLLDEPFTGLDETSAERLSTQLSSLREGGRTLILVTHDPRRAVELSERALILHHGEIRATPARGRPDKSAEDSRQAEGSNRAEDSSQAEGSNRAEGSHGADGAAFELAALRETLARLARDGETRDAA